MPVGWSKGFQVQIFFILKGTSQTGTVFLASLCVICATKQVGFLGTKLKFLLEATFPIISRWTRGFCSHWFKFY